MTGLAPLVRLWRRSWLAVRQWGLDQAKADPDYLLRRALVRADLER